jgi:hypothetical protein
VPRYRCEQPWPELRILLQQSARPTRRSFWSFDSPYGDRSQESARPLLWRAASPGRNFITLSQRSVSLCRHIR